MNNDYSKTDPKDALLVATNAYSGNYNKHIKFSPAINRLHRLSITYDKLIKDKKGKNGKGSGLESVLLSSLFSTFKP